MYTVHLTEVLFEAHAVGGLVDPCPSVDQDTPHPENFGGTKNDSIPEKFSGATAAEVISFLSKSTKLGFPSLLLTDFRTLNKYLGGVLTSFARTYVPVT